MPLLTALGTEQKRLPLTLCTKHDPFTCGAALEQMLLLKCDGFKLSTVASEQMPLTSCDGFELSSIGATADAITRSA